MDERTLNLQKLLSIYVNQIPFLDTVYIGIQMQITATGDGIGTLESFGAPKGEGGFNPTVPLPPKSEI
jgi:hypothetical protein